MRDRLIELLEDINNYKDGAPYVHINSSEREEVADYILADGWIRPPVKVGQKVYAVDKRSKLWWKGTIISFYYTKNCIEYGVLFDDGEFATYSQDCVFPTREEAENALKGGAE